MTRRPRKISQTEVYHVMVRGINRERIFVKEKDCKKMYKTLLEYMTDGIEIYAYCIMPNHMHLMVRGELAIITEYMRQILVAYAAYYNLSRERNGHVFQDRFRSECVEKESYFWNCLNYIHENPVKAGIVKTEGEYTYSSFKEYSDEKIQLVHEKAIKLKKKHPEYFNKIVEFNHHVIIDIKEEEDMQKEEYFYSQLKIFADTIGETSQVVADITKLRQQFIDYEYEKGILSKAMMIKKFLELRKK